jgi:hypothetical protein
MISEVLKRNTEFINEEDIAEQVRIDVVRNDYFKVLEAKVS